MTGKDDAAWFKFEPRPVDHTEFVGKQNGRVAMKKPLSHDDIREVSINALVAVVEDKLSPPRRAPGRRAPCSRRSARLAGCRTPAS